MPLSLPHPLSVGHIHQTEMRNKLFRTGYYYYIVIPKFKKIKYIQWPLET